MLFENVHKLFLFDSSNFETRANCCNKTTPSDTFRAILKRKLVENMFEGNKFVSEIFLSHCNFNVSPSFPEFADVCLKWNKLLKDTQKTHPGACAASCFTLSLNLTSLAAPLSYLIFLFIKTSFSMCQKFTMFRWETSLCQCSFALRCRPTSKIED